MPASLDPAPLLALQLNRSDGEFARLIGVTRNTVLRWRSGKVRSIYSATAERAAIALGRHPSELWAGVDLDPGWRDRAACIGEDRRIFFPTGHGSGGQVEAKKVCARCPVQAECLDWVLRNVRQGDDYGIWSGTNKNERAKLRKDLLREAS